MADRTDASTSDSAALEGAVRALLTDYSIETTPRGAVKVESFADLVPAGTRVYIAHVPGSSWDDTVSLAARLRQEGLDPVPHIVARRIDTVALLEEILARLVGEAGVTRVLAVAGDIEKPLGELDSALQVLEMGVFEKHGIRKINVAAHPEGHRDVGEAVLRDALVRKNAYAQRTGAEMNLVTQFGFATDPIFEWETRHAGVNRLPYIVGLAGLATMKTLLKFALESGVGPSIHALSRHAKNLTKLLTVTAPDDLVVALARHRLAKPDTQLAGVHFFPFGGFKRTADWANRIVEGDFELTDDGTGLVVA